MSQITVTFIMLKNISQKYQKYIECRTNLNPLLSLFELQYHLVMLSVRLSQKKLKSRRAHTINNKLGTRLLQFKRNINFLLS